MKPEIRSPVRAWTLALLIAISVSNAVVASCIATRPPDRDLWIELDSCSDTALEEISSELFLQAVGRTDEDWTGHALPRTRQLLRETPGVLIVAREPAGTLLAVALSSKEHDHERDWVPIGVGPWDRSQRESWVALDRVMRVHPDGMRREACALDRARFNLVVDRLKLRYRWR